MEEIQDIGRRLKNRGVGRLIFLENIKSSSFEGLENCIGECFWRVWEGLYKFFIFNICCYNILKIKNILIININLSLSKISIPKIIIKIILIKI